MANYTPIFEKPYPNGYEDLPSETTPVTADTLNDKDDAIVNIETYLEENPIGEGGASALSDLTDVDVSTVEDGQILKYNAETEMWENANGGGGGGGSLATLSDVDVSTVENGQIIRYNSVTEKWENSIEGGNNYSTTEQVIGTWIDGKPLYQKTIELTVPSSGRQNVNHNIQNIKKVIGYEGGFNSPSGNLYANPFGSIERWTSDVYKRMIYQITPTYIDVETASENYAMTITIKYTKTTD